VYIGKLGNAYFYKGEVAGQTDFLYGFGTAWIQNTTLSLRGCGGGITAWKGNNVTKFRNMYGVYIHNANVRKASNDLKIKGQCFLGRPWVSLMNARAHRNCCLANKIQNKLHRSLFANCELDDSINGRGYQEWSGDPRISKETMMAEYRSRSVDDIHEGAPRPLLIFC
jgi:pectin methylesterase-like acyl-CoA thioesterase